jgi:DNA-binding transcriptional ArsR family regulator
VVASRLLVRAPASSFLPRLAVVFADPIRLKIVSELYMQDMMSPTQFYELFGGGSATRVNRHFKRLAEFGWLRLVGKGRGDRRGGAEHFYRAPELAIFDSANWAELPSPIQREFSWRIFEQFAERVREALDASTFDAREDRHFTWTPLILDRAGWQRVIAAVDGLFESLFQEQDDAKLRIARSKVDPLLATVGIAAFESPRLERNRSGLMDLPPPDSPKHPASPMDLMKIAKVFADPVNLRIMTQLNLRPMSPTQFHEEFGCPKTTLYRKFRMLEEWGWLGRAEEKSGGRRRGSTETYFYAKEPAIFDSCNWSKASDSLRCSSSWRIFEQLAEQVREAFDVGTFDARPERHHTWTPLVLDEAGWQKVIGAVDGLFNWLFEEQADAKRRMKRSGELPVIATVYLAVFESPRPSAEAPVAPDFP